ncbi:MAG: ribosome recycling factor [Anaerolineales bacterium]|nr:ribosome recycling factor [Anaerolineales bacterium]MCL4258019.1 ribosome recycling factor [Anaerolineales bacterium]QYK50873.1 MAG: ribosome recycling factor [Anaerolineales bacterium]
MIADMLKETKERMQGAISSLKEDLSAIRTGRATPALIEKLMVEYYGQPTPLIQLASISVPEPRQLLIKPFDPGSIKDIEKAVQTSELGLTPNSDGKVVRLNLPPLTEERRRDLVKVVNARLEEANVAVRNIRRDVIKDMREYKDEKLISEDELKRGEDDVQKLTDETTGEIESLGKQKEKEVMEV